jgi:hypothetical protein
MLYDMKINRRMIDAALMAVLCAVLAVACNGSAESRRFEKCSVIAERFDAVLAGSTGACNTDADCGCYNPVSRKTVCGGITDKKTADRLRELEAEFHRAKCEWWVECGPWACVPVCARGRCVNGR